MVLSVEGQQIPFEASGDCGAGLLELPRSQDSAGADQQEPVFVRQLFGNEVRCPQF